MNRLARYALGCIAAIGAQGLALRFMSAVAGARLHEHLLDYAIDSALSQGEVALLVFQLLWALPAVALMTCALELLSPRLATEAPGWFEGKKRFWPVLGVTVMALLASWAARTWVTQRADFTDDERLYWYQAQVLLEGRVLGPLPPVPQAFDSDFIMRSRDGSGLTGLFTVGQPLLFAAGSLLGDRDLFQWASVGMLVLLTWALSNALGLRSVSAWGAAALVAVSPWLVFGSASRHNDLPTAAFTTGALWCALRWNRERRLGWVMLGAGCVAAVELLRPLDGVVLAVALLLAWLRTMWSMKARRAGWLALVAGAFTLALGTAFQFFVNWKATGHPLTPTYDLWLERDWPTAVRFGFGTGSWGYEQTPGSMLQKTVSAAARIAQWLTGNVLLAAVGALGLTSSQLRERAAVVLGWAVLFIAGYAAFLFPSTQDFGSMYHLPLLPLLSVAMVLGAERLAAASKRFRLVPVAAVVVGAMTFVPFQVRRLRQVAESVTRPMKAAALAQARANAPVLVLWKRLWPPGERQNWVRFPPPLSPRREEPVLWAEDGVVSVSDLRAAFPERVILRLEWAGGEPTVDVVTKDR